MVRMGIILPRRQKLLKFEFFQNDLEAKNELKPARIFLCIKYILVSQVMADDASVAK